MKMLVMAFMAILACFSKAEAQNEKRDEINLELKWLYDFRHPNMLDADQIADTALAAHDLLVKTPLILMGRMSEKLNPTYRDKTYVIGGLTLSLFIESKVTFIEHEYGHFRAFSRIGMTDYAGGIAEEWESARPINSPFDLANKWPNNDFVVGVTEKDFQNHFGILTTDQQNKADVLIEAGGINQRNYSTDRLIEQRIFTGSAHVLDGIPWFFGINNTVAYIRKDEGDLEDYVNTLKELKVRTSVARIKAMSLVRYASGSTIAMFSGMYNWLENNQTTIGKPPRFWPEFASYLTAEGPTFKTAIPMEFSGLWITPSFEKASENNEAGLKIQYERTTAAVYKNTSGGYSLSFGQGLKIGILEFGADIYYHSGYTFDREIRGKIPDFIDQRDWGYRVYAGISLSF